jgi:hypothetical protein
VTDNAALLLNFVTLAESGDPSVKLEVGKTFLDPDDFQILNRLYVNGAPVLAFTMEELLDAGLTVDRIARFRTRDSV